MTRCVRASMIAVVALLGCRESSVSAPIVSEISLIRLRADSASYLQNSALKVRSRLIVRSEAEWRDAWRELWRGSLSTPPLPSADFTRELVIVAAAGEVGSSGYDIRIEAATVRDGRLQLRVRTISPGPRCGAYAVMAQPVDIARVTRTDLPIEFDERSENTVCP